MDPHGFNQHATLPHGLAADHVRRAMSDFVAFLTFINRQLHSRGIERLETMLMPANFSSVVGEFMNSTIPKYCLTLVKNRYHNGHPDLIPAGIFPGDAAQHAHLGIEIKASRYARGWQGHNPEDSWLMVFVFDSNRPNDPAKGVPPRPFRFVTVVGAQLTQADWVFAGRSATSRRTITASVTTSGYEKMTANRIYQAPG
ncbi:MAG TPA: hypothetical protein VFW96_02445 [Thermomicrobiales bacterium]|nr:hypothetical protein [Thermomicrobiales bacterium]